MLKLPVAKHTPGLPEQGRATPMRNVFRQEDPSTFAVMRMCVFVLAPCYMTCGRGDSGAKVPADSLTKSDAPTC